MTRPLAPLNQAPLANINAPQFAVYENQQNPNPNLNNDNDWLLESGDGEVALGTPDFDERQYHIDDDGMIREKTYLQKVAGFFSDVFYGLNKATGLPVADAAPNQENPKAKKTFEMPTGNVDESYLKKVFNEAKSRMKFIPHGAATAEDIEKSFWEYCELANKEGRGYLVTYILQFSSEIIFDDPIDDFFENNGESLGGVYNNQDNSLTLSFSKFDGRVNKMNADHEGQHVLENTNRFTTDRKYADSCYKAFEKIARRAIECGASRERCDPVIEEYGRQYMKDALVMHKIPEGVNPADYKDRILEEDTESGKIPYKFIFSRGQAYRQHPDKRKEGVIAMIDRIRHVLTARHSDANHAESLLQSATDPAEIRSLTKYIDFIKNVERGSYLQEIAPHSLRDKVCGPHKLREAPQVVMESLEGVNTRAITSEARQRLKDEFSFDSTATMEVPDFRRYVADLKERGLTQDSAKSLPATAVRPSCDAQRFYSPHPMQCPKR